MWGRDGFCCVLSLFEVSDFAQYRRLGDVGFCRVSWGGLLFGFFGSNNVVGFMLIR